MSKNGKSETPRDGGKPKSCARCRIRNAQQKLICELVDKLGSKLNTEDGKATVGDYIRLLQLKKEMEEDQPREIRVTWVEQTESNVER